MPLPAGSAVDLRDQPDVANPWPSWDQRNSMACTAFAVAGAVHYLGMKRHREAAFAPSRLHNYYWELVRRGIVKAGAPVDLSRTDRTHFGAHVSDAIEAVRERGVVPSGMWRPAGAPAPTDDEDDWSFHGPPSEHMSALGASHRAVRHLWDARDPARVEACLIEGFPVTVPIAVGKPYTTADRPTDDGRRGIVTMSGRGDTYHGVYHALLLVGYERARQEFAFRNSHGDGWGDAGHGRIPYAWITDTQLASSLWTVRSVS